MSALSVEGPTLFRAKLVACQPEPISLADLSLIKKKKNNADTY